MNEQADARRPDLTTRRLAIDRSPLRAAGCVAMVTRMDRDIGRWWTSCTREGSTRGR